MNLVAQLSGLYGMQASAAQHRVSRVDVDRTGRLHVRLLQTHMGLPVLGAELAVHYDSHCAPIAIGGGNRLVPESLAVTPHLTVADARNAAAAALAQRQCMLVRFPSDPELVVDARWKVARLAYVTSLNATDARGMEYPWECCVDAEDGSIYLLRRKIRNAVPGFSSDVDNFWNVIIGGTRLPGEGGGYVEVNGSATSIMYPR